MTTALEFDVELPEFNVVVDDPETTVHVPEATVAVIAIEGAPSTVPGPGSPFEIVTQAEYDALSPPDPDTLYVVI